MEKPLRMRSHRSMGGADILVGGLLVSARGLTASSAVGMTAWSSTAERVPEALRASSGDSIITGLAGSAALLAYAGEFAVASVRLAIRITVNRCIFILMIQQVFER